MKISEYMKSNSYFDELSDKAAEIIKDKRIIRLKCTEEEDGHLVKAKALDKFNYVNKPKIVFKNGEISKTRCDCKAFRQKNSVCVHIAALLLECAEEYGDDLSAAPFAGSPAKKTGRKKTDKNGADTPESVSDTDEPEDNSGEVPGGSDDGSDENDKSGEKDNSIDNTSSDETDGEDGDVNFASFFEDTTDYDILSSDDVSEDFDDIEKQLGLDIPEDEDENFSPREMKILFGTELSTGKDVFWHPNDTEYVFHTNTGIIGTMGTGKTQFAMSMIKQIYDEQVNNYNGSPIGILIFDYKGDYSKDKNKDFKDSVDIKVLRPENLPYNPFALSPGRPENSDQSKLPLKTANAFADSISRIFGLGNLQQNTLLSCIKTAYLRCGIDYNDPATWNKPAPTFEQVYEIYREDPLYAKKDSLFSVMENLHDFAIFEPDQRKTCSLMKLIRGVVVFDISDLDRDIQNLIVAITLDHFYMQMKALGSSKTDGRYRQLRKLILVDEADNFMNRNTPSLTNIIKEGREFGVGVILSTQSLEHFSSRQKDYSKYILTWVVHNAGDLSQRDVEYVFKLEPKNPDIVRIYSEIKILKKHECIVKVSNNPPVTIKGKAFWELYLEKKYNT